MNRSLASASSRWLAIVRILFFIWILYSVVSISLSLPTYYQSFRALEPGDVSGEPFFSWTTQQIQSVLVDLEILPALIAGVSFSASVICLLCFWMVGGLLLWRRSDTWAGLLAAFILFATGPGFSSLLLSQSSNIPWASIIGELTALLAWPTFFVFLYLFPNGKFVPRFTRYLAVLPYLIFIIQLIYPDGSTVVSFLTGIFIAYAFGGLISQIYRYRKVSTIEERQQTKWVVFALGIFLVGLILGILLPAVIPSIAIGSPTGFWYEIVNGVFGVFVTALIPISIGFSILRYRLWDIDIIIRKTLVYSALTLLLGLVYFGLVTLLQNLFSSITGEQSTPAIVLSTLAIAALFNPLRRRLQDFIDRRFFRKKYDAQKTLAAFAKTAREATDLEALSAELLRVLQETMQPEQTSLWLKPTTKSRSLSANAPTSPDLGRGGAVLLQKVAEG